MEFAYTDKVEGLRGQIQDFMDTHIVPRIQDWRREVHAGMYPVSFMEELKTTARQQGLWNLFLPVDTDAAAPPAATKPARPFEADLDVFGPLFRFLLRPSAEVD